MSRLAWARLLGCSLLLWVGMSAAESQRFGDLEVTYSVVNSTFVSPDVASHYQLVRGHDRAFVNLVILDQASPDKPQALSARVEGRTWDLLQNQFLKFQEIREGEAVYYIADFQFSDAEMRYFEINLLPAEAQRSLQLKFQHQVYVD